MSRGMDGRWPPTGAGGGGGRSSGSGGLPPGVGGRGGRLLFGCGGGGAEKPGLEPDEEPPGGGGRGPCLPGGTLGGGGAEAGLGLGPLGSDGGSGPPRERKDWVGRGVLGTGGGGPPGVSCLEKLGRPLDKSGTWLRTPPGAPGSLGGPPPKGVGPQERPPGGSTGPRLGPESLVSLFPADLSFGIPPANRPPLSDFSLSALDAATSVCVHRRISRTFRRQREEAPLLSPHENAKGERQPHAAENRTRAER